MKKYLQTLPLWIKAIAPICMVLLHVLYVTPQKRTDLHWYIYVALFVYCFIIGESQNILREMKREIRKVFL